MTKLETILLILLTILMIICLIPNAEAQERPTNKAVRAIIGESANQGYQGMLAVAVGIRNRGSLRGVYGVNSPIVDKQPQWIWQMAERAWTESQWNLLHSGTHWESTDFPVPGWANDMVVVYKHKKHIFYKESND